MIARFSSQAAAYASASLRFLASVTETMAGDDYGQLAGKVALAKVQATKTLEAWTKLRRGKWSVVRESFHRRRFTRVKLDQRVITGYYCVIQRFMFVSRCQSDMSLVFETLEPPAL